MASLDSAPGSSARPSFDPTALDHLFPTVYAELHRLAQRYLRHERIDHTLNTTALVHEAYLRLSEQTRAGISDRHHLLALAVRAMRRVLVDHARKHHTAKRGGGRRQVRLEDTAIVVEERAETLISLDEALERLEALDPRLCRVVECRFFSGLTEAETADVLQVTTRTIQRDWAKARAWLYRELDG
ncbi:MAG TPA: sigma-70 family RNA polymerase sigma factor [Longimicrobiaceae bacterium]|nr:sigma-70 family RNA polymerase sigma factor [Longimicrobiaceae bacterium]